MLQYDLFTVLNLYRYDTTFFDAHLFYFRKNVYQSSTNKQKINAKQNNMQTLGKLTHVSDATRPQLVRV